MKGRKMTKTPFTNEKGEIVINLKPLRDIVLLFVPPPPDKMGEAQVLVIPEQFKDKYYRPEAIVLAVGPGYYGKDGIWREVSNELKPGVKVTFDMNCPWRQRITGLDGKEYIVVMCTEQDIQCIMDGSK